MRSLTADDASAHYRRVATEILAGRVIPFLGAGVNVCGRPPGAAWQAHQYLPSGPELARYLAEYFGYPHKPVSDLARASQYVAIMSGSGPLYEELRRLFDADYRLTPVHYFLASLPAVLRNKADPPRYQVIVTTNYDDALERAFHATHESFDLVSYMADGEHRGKFFHTTPEGDQRLIERPNEYRGLSPDLRTVIMKIHGAVDRRNPEGDSYVITEDHYIDYLTRTDIGTLVPVTLAAVLRRRHFLFLGYSLRDWNLRVILQRIWGSQKLSYKSWAVKLDPEPFEQEYWVKRDVTTIDVSLEDYVAALSAALDTLPAGVPSD